MRLSIRYWLRRWLVPELEPSQAGPTPMPSVWLEWRVGVGGDSLDELNKLLDAESPSWGLH